MQSTATVLEATPSTWEADLSALRDAVLSVGRSSSEQMEAACSFLSRAQAPDWAPEANVRSRSSTRVPAGNELVVQLLVRHRPQGLELRGVLALGQSLREFQCIACEAESISAAWQKLELISWKSNSGRELMRELIHMRSRASQLLLSSLQALASFNGNLAKQAARHQLGLSANFSIGLRRLVSFVSHGESNMRQAMALERILASLERVGDHAKNVCEQAAYCNDGKRSEHIVRPMKSAFIREQPTGLAFETV